MSEFPNVLIRASAGTGKTWQLTNRYLGLLQAGAPVDEMLASTFTRKAAGEIIDRVLLRLAEAADDADQRAALSAGLDGETLDQARCDELLERITGQLHRLRIATLDSFFAQLASSFTLELGLPAGWTIMEGVQELQLRNEAIERMLRDDTTRDVARLVHLITKGEAERSVSDLVRGTVMELYALYEETSPEAWKRFPAAPVLEDDALSAAIHDIQQADLPEDRRIARARDKDVEAALAGDWERFIAQGLAAKVLDGSCTYYRKPLPAPVVTAYTVLLEHARGVFLEQLASQTEATWQLLNRFDAEYRRLKRARRVLRFDDITRRLATLTGDELVERQHFRLDADLTHLMLDEFQDTSLPQWQVLRPFARRLARGESQRSFLWMGGGRSLFCVGDVKQAIYGWRGGRSEIFETLESDLGDVELRALNQSYRSAPPVIDTVNRVFGNLTGHEHLESLATPLAQWQEYFQPHTTARQEMPGYARLVAACRPEGSQRSADAVLGYAASEIARLVEETGGRSIGVLVRRNSVVARMIFELRQRGVAASEEGGNPLTDSAAVQLILSLLRLADHPGDTAARYHLRHSPLRESCGIRSLDDNSGSYGLSRSLRRELLERGYGSTLDHWTEPLRAALNRRERNRLEQLVDLAYAYQPLASLRTADFLNFVAEERVADPSAAPVRVMTIHQAKGLQFDTVVLPELDHELIGQRDPYVAGRPGRAQPVDRVCLYRNSDIQALLPSELQDLFAASLAESVHEAMCLLYVALTRAVHALHMIVAPPNANEKNLPKTFAGLLRATLAPGRLLEPEETGFVVGDPEWHAAVPSREPGMTRTAGSSITDEPARIELQGATPEPAAAPRRTSPSRLEGGDLTPAATLLDLQGDLALRRGTLIHAWFEQVEWLDDGLPETADLLKAARRCETRGLDFDMLQSTFLQMLRQPAVERVLSRSFYEPPREAALAAAIPEELREEQLRVTVHRERRFLVRENGDDGEGGSLLSGTFDRLALLYHGDELVAADIVDFKTDRLPHGSQDAHDRVDHYRPQLEAYRRAAAQLFRLPEQRISTRLLFVAAGRADAVRAGGRE